MFPNYFIFPPIPGGLFEHSYRGQEQAFRYSVEKINARRDVLPNTRLTYDIQQSPNSDSFVAARRGNINGYGIG